MQLNVTLIIFLVLLMTLCGTFGAFFFKRAVTVLEKIDMKHFIKILLCPWLYIGGFLYVIGGIFNILLLRKLDYSIVYPMSSLTYVWTMFSSFFLLKEPLNAKKIIAVSLIIIGIFIINIK